MNSEAGPLVSSLISILSHLDEATPTRGKHCEVFKQI